MGWRGAPPPFYPSAEHTALDRKHLSEVLPKLFLTNFKGAEDPLELKRVAATHVAAVGDEFMEDEASGLTVWKKGGHNKASNTAPDALLFSHQMPSFSLVLLSPHSHCFFAPCCEDITDDDHQGEVMAESLHDAADFIHGALTSGGCVVVHCAAGISRSATVILGYFVIHRSMSLRDAFAHLYSCRSCVWANDGFMASLVALEIQVRGTSTITTSEYEHWGESKPMSSRAKLRATPNLAPNPTPTSHYHPNANPDPDPNLTPNSTPNVTPKPGEYEGPELASATGGARPLPPLPMGMPRMNRDDTCLEDEIRELAIAEALVASEHRFAIKLQRQARSWLRRRQHASDEPSDEPGPRRPRVGAS